MLNTLIAVVKGRVQGVGFRYFTKSRAETLHLSGWVRNLPDGTVEALATGPDSNLEQFLQYLRTGPVGSRVEQVDFQWLKDTPAVRGFEIRG